MLYDLLQDIVLILLSCCIILKVPRFFLPNRSSGTQYLLSLIFHMANMLATKIVILNLLKINHTITVLLISITVNPRPIILKHSVQLLLWPCPITHVGICEWAKILIISASNLFTLNDWSARNHIFIYCKMLAPNGSKYRVLSC